MFKSVKKQDLLIVFLLSIMMLVVGYYYVNRQARNQLWLKTYPIRAQLALTHISCSNNSPSWLKDIIIYQTKYGNAPANQIAFLDKQNNLHHCESGYIGQYPILSEPVSTDTRFRYASVSKLWTSDAILNLVRQGKINLNDPLSKYLPEINYPHDSRINDITIRQLLLHRAGFDRNNVRGHDMFGIGESICPNNFEKLNSIELTFTPNQKVSYSNLGYCLLGEVISREMNKSFIETISESYQLSDSTLEYIGKKSLSDEVSYNYVETGISGVGNIYTAFDYQGLASAAGLSGSAIDLAKQVKAMASKPEPNILSLDDTLSCNSSIMRDCYGYAMFAYQNSDKHQKVYYRDGKLLGLSSLVAVSEDKQVVTLLSNGNSKEDRWHYDKTKYMLSEQLSQD